MNVRPLFVLLFSTLSGWAVDSAIPAAFPAARYEKLVENSPFALATAQAPAAAPENTAGFAEGWYISGLARMDGEDFVTIKSRDQSIQFSLFGTVENREHAVALDHVDWSPEIGKSRVTIRKGDELANLEFNQAELQNPASLAPPVATLRTGAAAPTIPRPGSMPAPVGIRPPVANQPGGIRPRIPPANVQPNANVLPLPGARLPNAALNNAAGPNANAANAANNANPGRRRIRVINSGQPNP